MKKKTNAISPPFLTLVLFCWLFTACESPRKERALEIDYKRILPFVNTLPNDSLLPEIQTFLLHNRDNVVTTKNGSHIYLPKDLFANDVGEKAESYTICIAEVFSKQDIIFSNLETRYGEQLLESKGMFFIQAFDTEGTELVLRSGKQISIELADQSFDMEMKLFRSDRSETGVNWTDPVDNESYLVTIPLPKDNFLLNHAISQYYDTTGKMVDIQNSFIATREFITSRFPGSLADSGAYFKIYMDNRHKNLYEADSICVLYEKERRQRWVAKGFTTNTKYRGAPNFMDTLMFHSRLSQRLGKVKLIETFGVNLDLPDARERLKRFHLSETEIDQALLIHQRRKNAIASLKANEGFSYFFNLNKLGWYNLDKILASNNLKEFDLKISVEGITYSETSCYLIFNDRNTILRGHMLEDGFFTINFAKNYKVKLPANEKITIIAISYQEEAVYTDTTSFLVVMYHLVVADSSNECSPLKPEFLLR